jgi:hypothetical protein
VQEKVEERVEYWIFRDAKEIASLVASRINDHFGKCLYSVGEMSAEFEVSWPYALDEEKKE